MRTLQQIRPVGGDARVDAPRRSAAEEVTRRPVARGIVPDLEPDFPSRVVDASTWRPPPRASVLTDLGWPGALDGPGWLALADVPRREGGVVGGLAGLPVAAEGAGERVRSACAAGLAILVAIAIAALLLAIAFRSVGAIIERSAEAEGAESGPVRATRPAPSGGVGAPADECGATRFAAELADDEALFDAYLASCGPTGRRGAE